MPYRHVRSFHIALFLLAVFAITMVVLPPHVSSDSSTYLDAMSVIRTGIAPAGFVPNRILTTSAGLFSVLSVEKLTGDTFTAWMIVNGLLFLLAGYFFSRLLDELFDSRAVTWIGTILFATNYAVISFGLNYLMDMGGWAFYIMSTYTAWRYWQNGERKFLLASALAVGIGGLFKEYAFLGFLVLACAIAVKKQWRDFLPAALLSFLPAALWYGHVLSAYGYGYAQWFGKNEARYHASFFHALVEYIKSFGSLYMFGWFLFVAGLYEWKRIPKFVWFVGVSALPVLVWPAVTQRILFISMPFAILVSCVPVKKYESRWYWFLPLLVLYVLSMYTMDSYVLGHVSLGAIIPFLK